MARRGPKGNSPEMQRTKGETRPSRVVVSLYPDHASRPDPDVIDPPAGMTAAGRKIWAVKVARYRQRGQKVGGFEDGLRQFCELEALLNKAWRTGGPTMAMVAQHRIWSAEFFDTPAAMRVKPDGTSKKANPFDAI